MPYGIELMKAGGAQASGNFINEGMGLLFAGPKRKAQMKTAQQMQDLQMKGNKEMTDYNMMKQLEMWEATGYGAQVDQMKKAGINPALLYGMGSGGGQTAQVNTGNVQGQSAQTPQASRGGEGMGLMVGQMGLLQATKENIEADTANKKAQTTKTTGVDTTEAQGRIKGIELSNEFLNKSMKERLDIINTEMGRAIIELDRAELGRQLDRQTIIQKTDILKAEAIGAVLQNALIGSQISTNKQAIEESKQRVEQSRAQIGKWAEEIMQGWESIDQKEKDLRLDAITLKINQLYPKQITPNAYGFEHDKSQVREAIDKIMKWEGGKINK